MIRAGLPAITTLSPNDFVTTLPAPTITLLPKVTPGQIIAPPPIHASSPMVTSLLCRKLHCVVIVDQGG